MCFTASWSTPSMNTPTPTSPFLSHPHPLFTHGGQHTHIDYTDFFLKSTLLHYADNTCLTRRNTVALKYVNIQKLTIFHAREHFETFSASAAGKGRRNRDVPVASREYFSASITSVDNDVCSFFLSFSPTGQGHLHHLHFMELFLRRRF